MSVDYRMKILRRSDGKVVAEAYVNCIKSILEVVDEDALPTNGEKMSIDKFYDLGREMWDQYDKYRDDIAKLRENLPRCVSVDVKHEMENEIGYKEEMLDDYRYASYAASKVAGMIECLVEDRVVSSSERAGSDGEDDDPETVLAYRANGTKDEKGEIKCLWAHDVDIVINGEW